MKKLALLFVAVFCYISCGFSQKSPHLVVNKESSSGVLTLETSYVECQATQEDEPNLFIGFTFVRPRHLESYLYINLRYLKTQVGASFIPGGRCLITKMSGKTIILEQLPDSVGESKEFVGEDGKLSSWLYASYICRDMKGLFDGTDPAKSIGFGAFPHVYSAEYTEEANPVNMAIVQAIDPIIKGLQKRKKYVAEEWMAFD